MKQVRREINSSYRNIRARVVRSERSASLTRRPRSRLAHLVSCLTCRVLPKQSSSQTSSQAPRPSPSVYLTCHEQAHLV